MSGRAERRRIMFNRATNRPAEISAGPRVDASQKFNNAIPSCVAGVHLWIVMSCYVVRQPREMVLSGEQWHLDLENLLSVDGPICYWCENPWRPDVGACTGPA